ncbi:MAG: DUF2029 domain-containing protein, partial [Planctomycetes bacterium]|nr:DUF2029 domain-containing protein [Planctomycetota bacterium]
AILVAVAIGVGLWLERRSNTGDLEVYYQVVKRIGKGQDLYHYREGPNPQRPTAYLYPPPFAVAFYPLTRLHFPFLRSLWGALGVLLAARCLWLGWRLVWAGRPPPPKRVAVLCFGLGLLVSLRFVWSDIGHGQVNLLVAWLTLEGIAAAEADGLSERAGFWLAAAVVIKLTPAIVVALYLVRGRWRLMGWCALWGVLFLWLPALVWGLGLNGDYLWRFASEVTPWNAKFHASVGNNVALPGAILRLLSGSGDAGTAPVPFLFGLTVESVRPYLSAVSLGFLVATLAVARKRAAPIALGIALAATPLISPIAWKPHLVVLILPGLLAARLVLSPGPRLARGLLIAGGVLLVGTGRLVLGRELAEVALRWGGTSLGLLLLWAGLVAWPRPCQVEDSPLSSPQ